MPILGSFASGAISTVGLAQQAMLAFLKASTAISGSSFVLQQLIGGQDGSYIAGFNNSITGQSSFAADGDYLVTGSGWTNEVFVWNLSDGSLHMTIPAPYVPPQTNGYGWQIDIHGDYFITGNGGTGGGYTTIHNVSTGALITSFTGAARNVAINENYAVACASGGPIKIFELATSTLTTFQDPNGGLSDEMDISGNNLIIAPNNGSLITVHDIPTALSNGNLNTTSLTINTTVSYFQTLIAEGNYLALGRTSDVNKSIFVYDLTTGTLLHTLPAPVGASAAFGNAIDIKGNYLVAGHRGQEQYSPTAVYDLTTGILLQTFTGDDIPDTSTWQNPDVDKQLGTAVAITDSKTIIGSESGGESANNWLGAFLIYSNPSQSAPAEESTGPADWSNATLAYTLDNPNPYSTPAGDVFGKVVAISGDYAIVGALYEDDGGGINSGKAYIFNVATGVEVHTLNNPNAYSTSLQDSFGSSVSISDTHAIVGAPGEDDSDGTMSGKAYIFNVATGALVHTLNDPNPYSSPAGDQFGYSVSISDDYAIVGATGEDDASGEYSGKAYIFNVATGALVHTLDNPNSDGILGPYGDAFGFSVAISGDHAIVGALREGDAGDNNSGKAYIFNVITGTLVHTLDNPSAYGTSTSDYFGRIVAISGDYAIVGASSEDDAGDNNSGKAYIFDVTTGSLLYTLDNPNAYGTSDSDFFGDSVAISGGRAIVGAVAEDEDGNSSSGKSYIFSASAAPAAPAADSAWNINLADVTYVAEHNLNPPITNAAFALTLSTDGTKLYVCGITQSPPRRDEVVQYSLSTAFDISTASYDNIKFNPSSQDTYPMGIAFNTDGTKMFLVGSGTHVVFQYSLSTPWDIGTASYDNLSISAGGAFGIHFNADGTKMYTIGYDFEVAGVRSFSLSTGFDLSTATDDLTSYSSIAVTGGNPYAAALNPDGTKMYILGYSNKSIYRYSLSTAFDVSTATYDNESISLDTELNVTYNMEISRDGTKIYVVGETGDSSKSVLQFDTGL
jgi:hypothetical protein